MSWVPPTWGGIGKSKPWTGSPHHSTGASRIPGASKAGTRDSSGGATRAFSIAVPSAGEKASRDCGACARAMATGSSKCSSVPAAPLSDRLNKIHVPQQPDVPELSQRKRRSSNSRPGGGPPLSAEVYVSRWSERGDARFLLVLLSSARPAPGGTDE